jgi:hypothetical protein
MTGMELKEMKINVETQIEMLNKLCVRYGHEEEMIHVVNEANVTIENTDLKDVNEEASDVTGDVGTRQLYETFKKRGLNCMYDGEFTSWLMEICGSTIFDMLHPKDETNEHSEFSNKVWRNEVIYDHFDWFDEIADKLFIFINVIYHVYLCLPLR